MRKCRKCGGEYPMEFFPKRGNEIGRWKMLQVLYLQDEE